MFSSIYTQPSGKRYRRKDFFEKKKDVPSGTSCCTVFLAKFIGCSLPILAKKVGFDPAVMAGPFITTIVDVTSLLLLFGLALMLVPKMV